MGQAELGDSVDFKDRIILGDAEVVMARMDEASVGLVFGSPPYGDARAYGIDFKLKGQGWVDWMVPKVLASLRVCKGLVAFVVEGKTRKFRWSATPALLMADLHRVGVHLRKPPLYRRDGIPGSGGPDWLKNHYELIVCCTNGGKLPWSDNAAMGHPCKFGPGGAPSHRTKSGKPVGDRPLEADMGEPPAATSKRIGRHRARRQAGHAYKPPRKANPGNIVDCGCGGGGQIGSKLAHENEAPFPEILAEFFIRSFCPPGGIVLDPFAGSGTTCAVAAKMGRHFIGIDIRESQVQLAEKRLRESCPLLLEARK